jgi:PiT family inorganic phosphate transporter
MIDISIVNPDVILAGLIGAITWNLVTWWYGIPSSSSHALLGGYAGAAVARAGFSAVIPAGWIKTVVFIVLSPMIGLVLGLGMMTATFWIFRNARPARVDRLFRVLQLASSALFSLSHGANDAQKTMGIIMSLLLASQVAVGQVGGVFSFLRVDNPNDIPMWVKAGAHIAIGLGTLMGGWRIIHTMGSRVTRLRPVGGFCAETGGAMSILLATGLGIPVSTTHTISGAIVGVGTTTRLSAVRWGVAGQMIWAWLLTIPAAAFVAAVSYLVIHFARA